jgi:hypothetical protein
MVCGCFALNAQVLADFITHGLRPVSENEGDGGMFLMAGCP